jgi:protein tyrosine phosphatase (PTP) superfamily phosphohydrolase (DUF442 family)
MSRTDWIGRTVQWLTYRGPKFILMRITMQVFRQVTGRPVYRYSKIADGLYVGGQYRRRGWRSMQARGINSVVNLRRRGIQTWDAAPSYYLHLPTPDNTAPTIEALVAGVDFIKARIAAGDSVYIHCGVGVGRAPTLAAAYLVSTGMTPDEAWQQLRAVRPFIFPLKGQLQQVIEYAMLLEK